MYHFASRPRWLILHAVVGCVIALFCLAGFWQLHRLAERRAHNAEVRSALTLPRFDLDGYADLGGGKLPSYVRVRATGRYDTHNAIILRSRTLNDESGNHVLTPLVMSDGRGVLVDRGWIPFDTPVRRMTPPSGRVTVNGVLMPAEPKRPFSPDDPPRGHLTAVSRIDPTRIAKQVSYPLIDTYLLLQRQRPAQGDLPKIAPPPELTEGPHFAYAVQWFLFMGVAIVGYAALLRREAKKQAGIVRA